MRRSTKVRVNTSTHCQLFSLLLLVTSVKAWKKTDKKDFNENIIGMKPLSVVLNHMNHESGQSSPAALTLSCCAVMTGLTPSALTSLAAVMESRLVFTEVSNERVFFGDVSIFHTHHP